MERTPGSPLSCCTPRGSNIAFVVVIDAHGFAGAKRREYIEDQSVPIHSPELLAGVQLRGPTLEGLRHSGLDCSLAQFGVGGHAERVGPPARSNAMDFEPVDIAWGDQSLHLTELAERRSYLYANAGRRASQPCSLRRSNATAM